MKKVLCICGSPRKDGNSQAIAQRIMDVASSLGAETETVRLYDLNFKGCVACMACKTGAEECAHQDDLTPVLKKVREADILLLASPVYFAQVSGEFKSFMDRMYSMIKPNFHSVPDPSRLAPGKKCVMILTQGNPDESLFADVYETYAMGLGPGFLGFEMHLLRGCGLGPCGAAGQNAELMAKAEALGRELMG